jgi:uncharacterized protein YndB with AHSA1/START domain
MTAEGARSTSPRVMMVPEELSGHTLAPAAEPQYRLVAAPLREGSKVPDIFHDLLIKAQPSRVFQGVSRPADLDQWWTARSSGEPRLGMEYELWFGPQFDWRARVSRARPDAEFELELTRADPEWVGTKVGFQLQEQGASTQLRFHHRGWPQETEHYRVSCYCWAMYLRVLRRFLEYGERVPYERRLDV